MNNELLSFLEGILGKGYVFSKSEIYFKCPICKSADDKKKLAIKLDENNKSKYMRWHCWRNPKHAGKNLFSLLYQMDAPKGKKEELENIIGEKRYSYENFENNITSGLLNKSSGTYTLRLPTEFKSFIEINNSIEYKNALNYLVKKRNVSREDIIKNNLGYCDSGQYGGYIIMPSYDKNGELNYFDARSYYDSEMAYKKPPVTKNIIFNELYLNWSFPIVIVEGFFDANAVKRNVIPLLGKTIPGVIKTAIIKNRPPGVYMILDNDAINDSIVAIEYLIKNDIKVYLVEMPDGKDPAEIGFSKTWELIRKSTRMEFSDLIKYKVNL